MNIIHATQDGRRAAERIMTTTVLVYWKEEIFDDTTGQMVTVKHDLYNGKARIRQSGLAVSNVQSAGQFLAVQDLILSVPIEATGGINNGHLVEVLADPLDADLVGTAYRIAGDAAASQSTARRFKIERTSNNA